MAQVREINDPNELETIRLLWASLLPQTPGASFFHSLDWLETYWRHYGAGQQLRVLVVSSDGRPIGILPLVVRAESTRVGPARLLTYPLHDWGTYYGPIGPNTAATLLAGLNYVQRGPHNWDLLDLRWIDADAQDRRRTEVAMALAGFPARRERYACGAKIDLSGTWDAYWASRTSHWRNNVRRCEKRLQGMGQVEYVRYRPLGIAYDQADPRWDLYEACEEIARGSWQADSNTGTTLTHDEVRAFLRDAHATAARAGALDLNLLLLAGRPVAFNYAYHYGGTIYGLRMGYDARITTGGAGTVLHRLMIEDSFRRSDRAYDLGANYLECKRYWPTHLQMSYRYTHFMPTARGQALRVKRILSGWIGERRQEEQRKEEQRREPCAS